MARMISMPSLSRAMRSGRWVHRDPGLVVVDSQPACAEAELEAAPGHRVEGGGLLGHQHGVSKIVVENQRPNPQGDRGLGRHGECDHRRPLVIEVVGHVEGRVSEVFGLARQVTPLGRRLRARQLEGEAEGCHEPGSYGVNLLR